MQPTPRAHTNTRVVSIDLLRGIVMVIMALDHARMYFGEETWYAEPTNLATTTPLLFFTRWVTHFCAPVFVFLAGTSAFLYGSKKTGSAPVSSFLFTRGLWLLFVEIVIITFGWTFDLTFSFIILQVIWVIGLSMLVLSALVFLPIPLIFSIGILLVFGHNLLDPIRIQGGSFAFLWSALHQPQRFSWNQHLVNVVYPVLPWLGLMALGYATGTLFQPEVPAARRRIWLVAGGMAALALFLVLRSLHAYGEPHDWQQQTSGLFTGMSFLNTTKYPPSLHFLLMTMGPALIALALLERFPARPQNPFVVLGRVPFFFYILHIYFIHALALLALQYSGWDWREYILSTPRILSGRLARFGFGLGTVYAVWLAVVLALYPLCRWYQQVRENQPEAWWLRYL